MGEKKQARIAVYVDSETLILLRKQYANELSFNVNCSWQDFLRNLLCLGSGYLLKRRGDNA